MFQKSGYRNILAPKHAELDLEDLKTVNLYFEKNSPEIVVLAAGKVGGILENKSQPVEFLVKNLLIQLNTIQAAHIVNCRRVVLLGSSCMYLKETPQPMKEINLGSGKLEKTSLAYAISKIAGLQLGFSYNTQYELDRYLCLIPNSIYGPGDNFDPNTGHVLSSLIYKFHRAKETNAKSVELWGSGKPRREFIFSDDIANAILFLLEANVHTISEPINIGSGTDITIHDLANMIAEIVEYKGAINWDQTMPDGVIRKLLDTKKINDIGWIPTVKLGDGIASSYSWFLNSINRNDQ